MSTSTPSTRATILLGWSLAVCMAWAAQPQRILALPINQATCRQDLLAITWGDGRTGSVCTALLARPIQVPGRRFPLGSKLTGVASPDGSATFEWLVLPSGEAQEIHPITLHPGGARPDHEYWIQCAALPSRATAEQMVDDLGQALEELPSVQEAPRPGGDGRIVFRVRLGPFVSRDTAQRRLKDLASRLERLHLRPIIVMSKP